MLSFIAAAGALVGGVLLPARESRAQRQGADTTAIVRVRPTHEGAPVLGATVRADSIVRVVGADGLATLTLRAGAHELLVLRIGFLPDTVHVALRVGQDTTITVELERQAAGVEGVVISATRAERRVEDTPLRVEVIDEEEVAEKAAMTPGDIAMMMNETSGLRVATTSPSLGGANVRIQGLRGRYTLMLTDGLPLYGGQGGFGLLQIPPVDLARVEVIKGTASALYGSAALGGVINLVSRRAGDSTERELLLNQTSRGGTDGIVYLSGRASRDSPIGYSALASLHRQRENDIDDDGWADMAGYKRAVIRPRLFIDADQRSLFVTAGYTAEDRSGGTISGRTAPNGSPYDEGLRTNRADAGLVGRMMIDHRDIISVRASATDQRHRHVFGDVVERDVHRTIFGEVSATLPRGSVTTVGGLAFQDDRYSNRNVAGFDYAYRVPSAFGQVDFDAAQWLALSASARADWHNVYGTSVSPRVSALLRAPASVGLTGWTTRLSAGSGTFAPTPLTEDTEATGLTPVHPLDGLTRERALSGSLDVNGPVETPVGRLELNGTLYASRINDAVVVQPLETFAPSGQSELRLRNAPLPTRTWGAETLVRWLYGDVRVTASYAYLRATEWDVERGAANRRDVPLAPRHTAGVVGSIEHEGESRIGLEVYYTGRQSLENNPYRTESSPYLIVGVLAERQIDTPMGRARFFINAENLGNVRQTRFDSLLLPARGPGGRWTTDAWTELSGATINGGVRLRF